MPAQYNQAELIALITNLIIDNTTQQVTPKRVRDVLIPMVESLFFNFGQNEVSPTPLYVGWATSNSEMIAQVSRPYENYFGFVRNGDGSIFRVARYTSGSWVFYDIGGGGGGTDPVARDNELKLKAKGWGNTAEGIEVNDIVFGFKENNYFWESAICRSLSGGDQVRANYEELMGYNV